MIIYYKNNEIDRQQWDNCVMNSGVTKPYAYSWYLDFMSPGWEALVDDEYDSVFPIPSYIRFGLQYAASPPFIQQLGAFSPDKPASDVITEFLDYMPEVYKLTDLCVWQKINYPGYKVTEKSNIELDISDQYEKLWEKFTPECRKYISANARKKYKLEDDVSPEELTDLCIKNRLSNFKGIKSQTFDRLTELMKYCIDTKKGKIIGVRNARKKLIYGIFFIKIRRSITLIMEANTPVSITRHVGYMVINELLKKYASAADRLDFGGTSDGAASSMGFAFGGIIVPYYRIYRNRLFWPSALLK